MRGRKQCYRGYADVTAVWHRTDAIAHGLRPAGMRHLYPEVTVPALVNVGGPPWRDLL